MGVIMAQVRLYQQSFNGGEIADSMFSRVTDSKYQSGLAKCRNFLVEPQGPIVSRPGFSTSIRSRIRQSLRA